MQVVSPCFTGFRARRKVPRGKDVLPQPLLAGIGILPIQGKGQTDETKIPVNILFVQGLHYSLEVLLQQGNNSIGKWCV